MMSIVETEQMLSVYVYICTWLNARIRTYTAHIDDLALLSTFLSLWIVLEIMFEIVVSMKIKLNWCYP
jgi:hypothetical protein